MNQTSVRKKVTHLQISYAEQYVHRKAEQGIREHRLSAFTELHEIDNALGKQLDDWRFATTVEERKDKLAQLSWLAQFAIASDV